MAILDELGFKIDFNIIASGSGSASGVDGGAGFQTLAEFMGKGGENVGDELVVLFSHLEYACKRIAALVASPSNSNLAKSLDAAAAAGKSDERDKPKPLDIVAVRFLICFII